MKIFSVDQMMEIVSADDDVFFSCVGYGSQADIEPEIFSALGKNIVYEYEFLDRDGSNEKLSFIRIPRDSSPDRVATYLTHMSAAVLACVKDLSFLEKIPQRITRVACEPWNEIYGIDLVEAYFLDGYKWMALRGGDAGDHFFYYFEKKP